MMKVCKSLGASLGALTVAAALLFGAARADAVPITYTDFGVGSGSLGSTAFVDALVTVTGIGDTTGVFAVSSPFNGHGNGIGLVTISVAGVGTATLTSFGFVFSDQDAVPTAGGGFGQGRL